MRAPADDRVESERSQDADPAVAPDSPRRDAARMLAASLMLAAGRRTDPPSRALARALAATPAGRVVTRHQGADGPVPAALGRALRTAATRRVVPAERAWIERVERRREELAAERDVTEAIFSHGPPPSSRRWAGMLRPVPVSAACGVISIPPHWGLLLMRLVRELAPRSCVELGTGFGISAAYVGAGLELNRAGSLTTFEGAQSWAAIAEQGAADLGIDRLAIEVGPLSETLGAALPGLAPVDLVFVDADHARRATLDYFATLLPHLADPAVVVFDDIAFNAEMWDAWQQISADRRVTVAAGLGRMGIVVAGPR